MATVAGAAIAFSLLLAACKEGDATNAPTAAPTAAESAVTELIIEDLVEGTGATLAAGHTASVHYTGWLYAPDAADKKGKQFDSSLKRGVPFKFPVGNRRVIQGWDQGVVGMKVGGERRLIIPAALGYGAGGAGGGLIPPNATLLFEVELLGID